MNVSYAEFARGAPDVLRMLGTVYGHADDAVECLLWTQAAFGRVYQLVAATDELRIHPRARPSVVADTFGYTVRMDTLPLLLYATRLADLTIAEAPADEAVRICAENCVGAWVAPYLGARIAAAGLQSLINWTSPSDGSDEPPSAVIVTSPSDRTAPVPTIASAGSWEGALLDSSGIDRHPDDLTLLASRLGGPRRSLVIAARRPTANGDDAASAWGLAKTLQQGPAHLESVDFTASLREMIDCGCDVDERDHALWLRIAARIRLPSSERSRGQAG